jgi:hypothetical protein
MSDSWRSAQAGQILPWMGFVLIVLLAAGVILFWLGDATGIRSQAQTAADAAALAGEKELVSELEQPPVVIDGHSYPPRPDPTAISQRAADYARANGGTLLGSAQLIQTGYGWGYDVSVTVSGDSHLPQGSPDAGGGATAQARASTDPFSQPTDVIQASDPSCDASSLRGPRFTGPPSGDSGFFPANATNYAAGCEPLIAGRLDQLAQQLSIKLTGLEGSATGDGVTDDPAAQSHVCGAASQTGGLAHVSDAELGRFGLVRMPGEKTEIELTQQPPCSSSEKTTQAPGTNLGLGNPSVHLVALGGGPEGTLPTLPTGPVSVNETQLQVGCTIYTVWKDEHLSTFALQVALDVAMDESGFGSNTGGNASDPSQSVGVFQQISADGWGTIQEELNVTTATEMFFGGANLPGDSAHGLTYYLPLYPNEPVWYLAQKTQGSGAGEGSDGQSNYGKATNIAGMQSMLAKVTSGACGRQGAQPGAGA